MMTGAILLLLGFLSPQAQSSKRYCDAQNFFCFSYDDSLWGVEPLSGDVTRQSGLRAGTIVVLESKAALGSYHARFSVVRESLKPSWGDLHRYTVRALDFLRDQRFRIEQKRDILMGNHRAYEIRGSQRDFGLALRQIILLHDQSAYLLTLTLRLGQDISLRSHSLMFDSFEFALPVG